MPNLHVHYLHGNVKAFRAELEGTAAATTGRGGGGNNGSGSLGKSWNGLGTLSTPSGKGDPNERDAFGRTVLHLAAGSLGQQAYTFFSILLRNSDIRVNLQDYESGYTALHRALFVGNIRAARDLLARHDIDWSVKDAEGLTAFDLYNGTVDGTNPPRDAQGSDLYVWGVNRNFTLGTGDSSDKAYPDRVSLLTQNQAGNKPDPELRFHHVGVNDVVMSKLHTAVITSEARGNLSMCGFGSNGRLGRSVHSQLALTPLPDLPHTITDIALGQDHTLALTSGGYILSWGHNRFAQLGYPFDAPDAPNLGRVKDDEQIQVSPRRIVGPLKKEWVRGVAAGRMSSHLGYDKASNPVQILPRKVTAITQTVIDVALSDYAMICLLNSYEVVCFHHDANFRINFSTPRILSDAFPFRPPQATLRPMIEKVTSSGQTFAALSSIGDVFTFQLPNPLEDVSKDARDRHVTVKPQLIWALRKSFTAVKDVALGSDGTVIICTHSGHVFVRQRIKSGAGLKFRRIPYLQRATKVACNESGAFAAIRVDVKATAILLAGRTLEEDLALLQPHMRRFTNQMTAEDFDLRTAGKADEDEDENEGANPIHKDLACANRLCQILRRWRSDTTDSLFDWSAPLLGSDIHLVVGEVSIPAHRTILALRVPVISNIIRGAAVDKIIYKAEGGGRLVVDVCHPLVALLLLQYVYSDEVAAMWDARVARMIQSNYADLALAVGQIKADLTKLANSLGLAPLSTILESASKVQMPKKTLSSDLRNFFTSTYTNPPVPSTCDVVIRLADKEVSFSSVILRARCPFFEAMFADRDWTTERVDKGTVVVDMTHLKWRPMRMVFRYIHEGLEDDLFDYLHQETLDEFLDFVFEVLAAATELLLDRLVLVCSRVIIRHCNAYNAAALACEASFYQANTLKLSIFDYIVACMETMLESGLLDEMHEDVLLELCRHIEKKQLKKLSVSRSGELVNAATEKWKDWLAQQDIPAPRVRQAWKWKPRSPVISPVDLTTSQSRASRRMSQSPAVSPDIRPSAALQTGPDDIFAMDDDLPTPSSSNLAAQTPRGSRPVTPFDLNAGPSATKGPVWKSRAVEAEKIDLRSVMAEAAASKTPVKVPGSAQSLGRTPPSVRPPFTTSGSTPSKSPGLARSPPSSGPSSGPNGPWRAVDRSRSSFSAVQSSQTSSSPSASARAAGSQASPLPAAAKVITPVKLQPAPPGTIRKASSGAAWTTSSAFAPAAPVVRMSPDAKAFSLLAIQQQEQDFAERVKKPQTRSFMEIQEEERRAEAARAEEVEFMRWWEEEQARVAQEQGSIAAGGAARGRGRGRGRGGERGRKMPPQRGGAGGGGLTGGQRVQGDDRAADITGTSTPASAPTASGQGRRKKHEGTPGQAPRTPNLTGPRPSGPAKGGAS